MARTIQPDDDGEVICNFPAHRGKMLKEIADTDDGLRYLDWLVGHLEQQHERNHFYMALKRFLARPHITRAVEEAVSRKPPRRAPDPKPKPWWEK